MEKTSAVLTLFVLLPVVLGANPYRKFLQDATFCQEKDTVCKMSSGNYGCCPAADGVCCADGDHCCPSGFKCDLSAKQCLQYGDPALTEDMRVVVPVSGAKAALIKPAKPFRDDVGNVDCPGGGYCDDGNTCCLHISGDYACCSLANGNCCNNYMTCCPSGTVCDNANGNNCIKPSLDVLDWIPFLMKSPSSQRRL